MKIGMIGLGRMDANRIVAAGHQVVGDRRHPEQAELAFGGHEERRP